MKILTPLHSIHDMKRLAEAGAEEFYVGFSDPEWRERFGTYADLNRCSVYQDANRISAEDIPFYVSEAHTLGTSLFVVLNAPGYDDAELEYMQRYLQIFADAGADGIIVSTPEQVRLVKQYGLRAVASIMSAVYNSDIARYYRDAGADRIILPRELSTEDIRRIVNEVPEPEYEAFLMRNGCRHSDCYCLGLHGGPYGGLCYDQGLRRSEIFMPTGTSLETVNERDYNNYLYERVFRNQACGQCAIWRLLQCGISAVKIVGRMENVEEIEAAVQLTAYNRQIALASDSEAAYLSGMTMPEDRYAYCASGMSCYYPEIRYYTGYH